MKDSLFRASMAGLLGTLGDAITHLSGFFLIGTTTTGHYLARLMFPSGEITLFRWLIGVVAHFISGVAAGILLWLVYKYFGNARPYFKGIVFSFQLWVCHVAIVPNIINTPRLIVYRTESEAIVDLISHLVFGLIATTHFLKTNVTQEVI